MAVHSGLAADAVSRQRAADFANFVNDTCWLYSCCCCGYGCAAPTPCAYGQGKCLCCRSKFTSGAEFCGPLGLCSAMNKCLCLIEHSECPPTSLKIGCCNVFCCGGSPAPPAVLSADEAQNMAFFQNTFWCYYCCCEGQGCTDCGDPLVKARGKLCCIDSQSETADMCGEEGCAMHASKCCCAAQYSVYPPSITPGIGCCGVAVLRSGTEARDVALAQAPDQIEMTQH